MQEHNCRVRTTARRLEQVRDQLGFVVFAWKMNGLDFRGGAQVRQRNYPDRDSHPRLHTPYITK